MTIAIVLEVLCTTAPGRPPSNSPCHSVSLIGLHRQPTSTHLNSPLRYCAVRGPARATDALDSVAVDTRHMLRHEQPFLRHALSVVVLVFDVECVYVAGEITQERQAEVDEEVDAAAGDHEDAERGDCGRWGLVPGHDAVGGSQLTEDGQDDDEKSTEGHFFSRCESWFGCRGLCFLRRRAMG